MLCRVGRVIKQKLPIAIDSNMRHTKFLNCNATELYLTLPSIQEALVRSV